MLPRFGHCAIFVFCSLFSLDVSAQDFGSKGYIPYQTYHSTDFDSVNLSNGNLVLDITLLIYKQLGTLPPIRVYIQANGSSGGFVYECGSGDTVDNSHFPSVQTSPFLAATSYPHGGSTSASCNITRNDGGYGLVDDSGATHPIGASSTSANWIAVDGSYTVSGTPNNSPILVTGRTGLQYGLSGFPSFRSQPWYMGILSSINSVTDPSGNVLNRYPSTAGGVLPYEYYWVDSIGRTIPDINTALAQSAGCATRNYPGEIGGTIPLTFCYGATSTGGIDAGLGLTSITLPNSTSWGFTYSMINANAETDVSTIALPTGATISYQYEQLPSCVIGNVGGVAGAYSNAVTYRTINLNDGSAPQIWHYQYSSRTNSTTLTTTIVTDPDGNDTVHTFTAVGGAPCSLFETLTQYYSGSSTSGTLLKTVTTAYHDGGINPLSNNYLGERQELGIFPTTIITSWPNGEVKKEVNNNLSSSNGYFLNAGTSYPVFFGNLVQKLEYDYGNGSPGALLREEDYTYQWQKNSSYLAANMLELPYSTLVRDGSGVQVFSTTYGYDENNGSPQGVYGNQTSETRWLNGGTSPETQTVYNGQGMPNEEIDPNGNITTTTYDSTGIFPAQVQFPTTNGVQHVEKYEYDSNTGLMAQYTDQNGDTTSYGYDSMRRLTSVTYPDGGSESYAYNDSTPTPSFTYTKALNSEQTYTAVGIADGLGRITHTQLISDPAGTVFTDTTYDDLGRVQSASNPYRTTSDPTYGITSYSYDPLNRKQFQCQPDNSGTNSTTCTPQNSYQSWNYSGNVVIFQDEVGNQWQRTNDAMGRLTSVIEPGTLETVYGYDPIGNLLSVNQFGNGTTDYVRTRSFTYDSLSRLMQSYNPETGWICYGTTPSNVPPNGSNCTDGYDENGNLQYKIDARGITTNYSYDALNRLTEKSSSGGTGVSGFDYHYGYDYGDGTYGFNGIGRMTYESNWVNADTVYSYDPMGRVTREAYWRPSSPNNTSIAISATYDLAGNQSSLTYPDGRVVNLSWNGAGRLAQVADATSGYQYLASQTSYWPNGAVEGLWYGNGIANGHELNKRLQINEMQQARIGSDAPGTYTGNTFYFRKEFCYGPATAPLSGLIPGCPALSNGNNGNIWQMLDAQNGAHTQTFSYDSLNRLTSFAQVDGTLQQTYTYDSFGNLNQTLPGTLQNNLTFLSNNQIVGVDYDAGGNITAYNNGAYWSYYGYDAENKLTNVNSGSAIYTYDADGNRVRKDVGSDWTEYFEFEGQPLAEKNDDGSWSDYIFGDGQRLARADNYDVRIHMSGTNCSGCGSTNTFAGTSSLTAADNYVIRAGDLLTWRQYQDGVGSGGIDLWLNNNTQAALNDTDGQSIVADTTMNQWHLRTVDLSPYAGSSITNLSIWNNENGSPGSWDLYFGDISLVSTEGTFIPIYSRSMESLTTFQGPGISNLSVATEKVSTSAPPLTTTFYHGDQVGSTQLLTNAAGWPITSSAYYPFGAEVSPTYASGATGLGNHYKFTGKERDTESGNDYFGARYYASSMGRFMSPDWAAKPEAVPYSSLDNPQSLNLYSYVYNNPLSKADADGHIAIGDDALEAGALAVIGAAAVVVAYETTPAGQRNIQNISNGTSEIVGLTVTALKGTVSGWFSKGGKSAPAPATGDKTTTGPKAATAPGVTAGGQATNEHGQKLGPSGKPQVNNVDSNTREGAKNAGNKGSGTVEHPNPQEGDPHFHTTRADGTKVQDTTHYNYPK